MIADRNNQFANNANICLDSRSEMRNDLVTRGILRWWSAVSLADCCKSKKKKGNSSSRAHVSVSCRPFRSPSPPSSQSSSQLSCFLFRPFPQSSLPPSLPSPRLPRPPPPPWPFSSVQPKQPPCWLRPPSPHAVCSSFSTPPLDRSPNPPAMDQHIACAVQETVFPNHYLPYAQYHQNNPWLCVQVARRGTIWTAADL